MAVLVIADHDGSTVRDTTHKTVTAAKAISGDVDVLVLGQGAQAVADAAAKIDGVRKVLLAEGAGVAHGLAEAVTATVVPLAAGYDAVLVPANTDGKNYAPRIAAKLDVAPISDIVEVVSADTFVRPIYAGNALETIQTSDAKKVITVRPTAFAAAGNGGSAPVETVAAGGGPQVRFVLAEVVKGGRNWARPRSSSRAVALWVRPKSSRPSSSRWRTSWALPLVHRALLSTPATHRTTIRSARPVRSSRRKSTLVSASRALSSTWPV